MVYLIMTEDINKMPTIKGGIKFGKKMSDEDLAKFAKATGRTLISKNGVPVENKSSEK